jgi:dolichyl-phosphate-mannose-protein mannosyltransferase
MSWVATGFVVLIAAGLRLAGLAHPKAKIFDEIYYATEADELLHHGVEWQPDTNTGDFVVHPPLGKWLIAVGEWAAGYNTFGWRISAVVAGVLSILLIVRITRRLFHSTVLGCAAGLLMALDGLHFVLSRVALLDIFLTLFVVATFGCLVMDRDQRRVRVRRALAAGQPVGFVFPWWRAAAGICLGAAAAVKLSALFFVPALVFLVFVWEAGLARVVNRPHPWRYASARAGTALATMLVVGLAVYLASWTGWFLNDASSYRHYLAQHGKPEPRVIGALLNLWEYHKAGYNFHKGLHSPHPYQSWPWQWLLMGRPVAFYYETNGPCGSDKCSAEVLLLGTPILWWSFIPALAGLAWFGISQRDRRAAAIGLMIAAGLLPWFWYHYDGGRTMFVFYALPAEPFLVMAVVYVFGAFMGRAGPGRVGSADRRFLGAVALGGYLLIVAACFAYFHAIYVGDSIPYEAWWDRMWLGRRWV